MEPFHLIRHPERGNKEEAVQLDTLQERRENLPSKPVKPIKVDFGMYKKIAFLPSCIFLPSFSLQTDQVKLKTEAPSSSFPHSQVSLTTAAFWWRDQIGNSIDLSLQPQNVHLVSRCCA